MFARFVVNCSALSLAFVCFVSVSVSGAWVCLRQNQRTLRLTSTQWSSVDQPPPMKYHLCLGKHQNIAERRPPAHPPRDLGMKPGVQAVSKWDDR